MQSADSTRTKAYIALALVSFFWGTTYLATRVGVVYAHGFLLAAIRQLLAGSCLLIFCWWRGYAMPAWVDLKRVVGLGFLMIAFSNGLMTWSLQYIPSGLCAILSAMGTLWVVLFSHFLIARTQWSALLVAGLAASTLGVVGIFSENLTSLLEPDFAFGIGLTLLAVSTWSLGSVLTAKWKLGVPLLLSASIQMLSGGVALLVLVSILGWESLIFKPLELEFWLSIGYLVVAGSFVAYSAFLYTLTNLPPARASLYAYINPIVAVVLGWLWLGESLSAKTLISIAIALGGVYCINVSTAKAKG